LLGMLRARYEQKWHDRGINNFIDFVLEFS
jgi:hypothetical protein